MFSYCQSNDFQAGRNDGCIWPYHVRAVYRTLIDLLILVRLHRLSTLNSRLVVLCFSYLDSHSHFALQRSSPALAACGREARSWPPAVRIVLGWDDHNCGRPASARAGAGGHLPRSYWASVVESRHLNALAHLRPEAFVLHSGNPHVVSSACLRSTRKAMTAC